ncbi:hypothetical protein [Actinacidiphila oryziradicis]|uniref:Uncharacterized protein n=1 Tax=Actinacidiphila oryziradicis TaxID=2571141 RepID=A0A4U0T8L2_9ACTN|nr:hypothetical protein [Actinacidiphila oryziradicis]TKA10945.1 hypothetical protein FCI23_15145 [Actinacidiphila oryziradicis]
MAVGESADVYPVEGFVFVDEEAPGYLKAAAGARVVLPSFEPPYILVGRTLEQVFAQHWPGRLFRARVVPGATDEERAAMARANTGANTGFARAIAVDLLEEIPPSVLFGPRGDAVVRVLEAGLALDEERARRLASARDTTAGLEYGKAWGRWLADQPNGAPYRTWRHGSALAYPGAGPSRSPVGYGFLAIHHVVLTAARSCAGSDSLTVDEDGNEVLGEPWTSALFALLDAAMRFGAPQLTDGPVGEVLARAWNTVFEPVS